MSLNRTGPDALDPEATLPGEPGELDRPQTDRALRQGEQLGRYLVLDTLGRGAMGIVYSAYDPELDRKLALKLLLPGREGGDSAQRRLLREAQAIASLSHPNVVTVHDVGTVGDRVFVAMELVDGTSLGRWLRAQTRSRAEILDRFVQAGRGLAAAHAAGVVHRDFKPDNVLVGHDGRARVVDFGLARRDGPSSSDALDDDTEVSQRRAARLRELEASVAGGLVGTPAYMSPEQLSGEAGEARSDQFSFCVASYEALYGERPFAGEGLMELAGRVLDGEVREPPPSARVPARIRRVLLRGLAVDPGARYPDMDALLHELERAAMPRRARGLALGVGVLALGAGALSLSERSDDPCADAARQGSQLWGSARREAVARAFLAVELPYAAPTLERVRDDLDEHLGRWGELEQQLCEAADDPRATDDPGRICLADRLRETAILIEAFEHADEATVTQAVGMVRTLGDPAACADPSALAEPWPTDAELRKQVQEIRDELQRIRLASSAGHLDGLAERIDALDARARQLAFAPLLAELSSTRAAHLARTDFDEAIEGFDQTFTDALACGHDRIAFEAARHLTFEHGVAKRDFERGFAWGRRAEALRLRLGRGDREWIAVHTSVASIHALADDHERAEPMFREVLEVARRTDDPVQLSSVLNNFGAYYGEQHRVEEAVPLLEESVAIASELYSETHPTVLRTLGNLGTMAVMGHRYQEGLDRLRELLPRQQAVYGEIHGDVANNLEAQGFALGRLGRYEDSEAMRRRVIEIREELFGPNHPLVIRARGNLVTLLVTARRAELAEVELRATLDALERAPHAPLLTRLSLFADASRLAAWRGDANEALVLAEQHSAACQAESCPERHAETSRLLLAEGHLVAGDSARARALLEPLVDEDEEPSEHAVRVRFGLARALGAEGIALAHRAIGLAREGRLDSKAMIPEIEAWLREQP